MRFYLSPIIPDVKVIYKKCKKKKKKTTNIKKNTLAILNIYY